MKTTETNIVIEIEKKFVKDLLSGTISEVKVASDSYCPEISISKFGVNAPNHCEPYIFYNLKDGNVVLGTRQSRSVSSYRRTGEDAYLPIVKVTDLINFPGNLLTALDVNVLRDYINKKVTSTLEKSQSVFCAESDIASIVSILHNDSSDYQKITNIFFQFIHQDFCDSNSELITYLSDQLKTKLFGVSCRAELEVKDLASRLHTCLKNQRERGDYCDATRYFFDYKTIEDFFGEVLDVDWCTQNFVRLLIQDFISLSQDRDATETAIAKGINHSLNRASEKFDGIVINFGNIYFWLNHLGGEKLALIFDGLNKVSVDAKSVIYTTEDNVKEFKKFEELIESKSIKEFLDKLKDESSCDLSEVNIVGVKSLSRKFLKNVFNTSSSNFVLKATCDVCQYSLLAKQIELFVDVVGAFCENESFWKSDNIKYYTIDKFCEEMKTLSKTMSGATKLCERLNEIVLDGCELFKTVGEQQK